MAGRWRGRRLTAPAGDLVRPTTDRVKEALFSILGDAIGDALVLDLCCGSGGLGIEALSRGAKRAVFVDRARPALAAVRRNLAACQATPDEAEVVSGDALAWLSGPNFAPGDQPWLLLADPPYGQGLAGQMAEVLARRWEQGEFRAAALEHDKNETPTAAGLVADLRRYGSSFITILRPATPPD